MTSKTSIDPSRSFTSTLTAPALESAVKAEAYRALLACGRNRPRPRNEFGSGVDSSSSCTVGTPKYGFECGGSFGFGVGGNGE